MSEEHEHPQRIKYAIHLIERHWWGGRKTMVLFGKGSSVKEGELLIFGHNGELYSINYGRVRWMKAEPEEVNLRHS